MSTRRDRRARERAAHHAPAHAPARASLLRSPAVLAVALLAVAAVAGLIVLGQRETPLVPLQSQVPGLRASGNTLGAEAAAVTVEVWSDFQCPFCRTFAQGVERQLIQTAVAQGQAKLVHRAFAFLGPESDLAAQAADCAGEQAKFWDYHDRLFAEQRGENTGAFSKDNLKRFAVATGLSPSFNVCLDSGRYAADVRAERDAGQLKGVNATPTVFVNGKQFLNVQSIEELRKAIDAAR